MVTITGFEQRKSAKGETFLILLLEGGPQIQISQTTGKPYACVSKCTITCTFDEITARELIGTTLPGNIIRVPCEPYNFINPQTREEVTLDYRYTYQAPEGSQNEPKSHPRHLEEVEVL